MFRYQIPERHGNRCFGLSDPLSPSCGSPLRGRGTWHSDHKRRTIVTVVLLVERMLFGPCLVCCRRRQRPFVLDTTARPSSVADVSSRPLVLSLRSLSSSSSSHSVTPDPSRRSLLPSPFSDERTTICRGFSRLVLVLCGLIVGH